MAKRAFSALARAMVGRPPPHPRIPPVPVALSDTLDDVERRAAVMKALDDDCCGFLLLTVHRQDEQRGRIDLSVALAQEWWPAVRVTLGRIIRASR